MAVSPTQRQRAREEVRRSWGPYFLNASDELMDRVIDAIAGVLSEWRPIEEAPKDGTGIIVFAAPAHGLEGFVTFCRWHESAGFCVDELREPTDWQPLPDPPAHEAQSQQESG
jgi:hypothetical protein